MIGLLRKRRSIRKFKNIPVEKDKIDNLVKAALLSPSSRHINPWEFIVITQNDLIEKLSLSKEHGSAFLKNAPLAVVVCAKPDKSDVWVEDTSIASIIIQLEAENLGLGTCWVQIRNRKHNKNESSENYVKDLLNLPGCYSVESVIAVGYPAEEKSAYDLENLQYEKVYQNKFNKKYILAD